MKLLPLAPLGFAVPLLAACAIFAPAEQKAALKEAQRFADEVTDAYGVGHVRVILGGNEK